LRCIHCIVIVLLALISTNLAVPPACTLSNKLARADVSDANFCPFIWASGLTRPRGMDVAENGDLLVGETNQIRVLWDDDKDGVSGPNERAILATQSGLNHGIAITKLGGFIYASSATTVFRWPYYAGNRSSLGAAQQVIAGIPGSGHTTRSLVFSPDQSQLFIQVGSAGNVDSDSRQAMIRRWDISSFRDPLPLQWTSGTIFVDGIRNEVAMRFDPHGRLWGVENGVDNTQRADWGGDIHNDNPCEEINIFDTPGKFYGYPYCWSEGTLPSPPGKGPKTQWVQNEFRNTPPYNDSWCQNTNNVVPPFACLPAHNAPLDILFGNLTDASNFDYTAFVSMHGSWNRNPADGYKVFYVTFKNNIMNVINFLKYDGNTATGTGWIRPVGLGFIPCKWGKCLMVSSDTTNNIIALAYGVQSSTV